ncbi:hypothetical protein BUALT_Bualt09G0001500 [Buddleja alternifolia]|uniref:Uncharacterized protein n=1 Tax=Buddleja alternifolia TaxID=168488 RepID=A0AAV6X394_9LAMI|nr:hypothetical protein BUALT_Bualt09G0001500 [Buddleja alternifolia]
MSIASCDAFRRTKLKKWRPEAEVTESIIKEELEIEIAKDNFQFETEEIGLLVKVEELGMDRKGGSEVGFCSCHSVCFIFKRTPPSQTFVILTNLALNSGRLGAKESS